MARVKEPMWTTMVQSWTVWMMACSPFITHSLHPRRTSIKVVVLCYRPTMDLDRSSRHLQAFKSNCGSLRDTTRTGGVVSMCEGGAACRGG